MAARDTQEKLSLISGKYQVLSLAGRGGTGMVYKVRHLALDTIFALKVLPAEFRDNTEVVNRFHQEARVMARFNHPNIVRVSDVDKDGSTPYFVMEYVEGRSLSEYLVDRGPLAVREALEIARQVTLALDYAHSHSTAVVHRDIKPQNILMETDSQRAVVTDFGIAKVRGASAQTSADLMLGTLLYCAPEQILPNGEIDGRADLYSLGLVLYEMVTCRAFFADIDERTLVGKVLSAEENVPVFPTPVPAEFTALVRRAISRKLENRYQNAKELLKDIDACLALSLSSLEVHAPAQPIVTASSVTEHLQRDTLIPPTEPPRLLPREPSAGWYPSWAPVGGLLLAGVMSLWWLLGSGSTTPVSPIPENPVVVVAIPSPDPVSVLPVSIPENTTETTIEPQPQSSSLPTPPVPAETETPAPATTDNQPFPSPRRFRITTPTAVRESPTWASKEAVWLQPGARVYAVAQVGDWLKVESRAQPLKPPGFVWKADARRE